MAIVRRLTDGPLNHFFGYYGVNPWDASGQLHLSLQTEFHRRPPNVDDEAQVGVVDRDSGRFAQYGVTRAFNLQQGSMLHWIDAGHGEELTYNVWRDGKVRSLAVEKTSRDEREIDAAIAAVSADGRQAMGLSYDRMYHCRSVVGYANDAHPRSIEKTPADDGLFRIDLTTGRSDLILSFTDVIEFARRIPAAAFDGTVTGPVWFNHVVFNTDGSRMFFLCRMRTGSGGFRSSLWSMNPDGTDLALQIGFDHWISHFAWHDPATILISTDLRGKRQFFSFVDKSGEFTPFGDGVLPDDGHACYSPDRRHLVCDTYPYGPDHGSELMLYEIADGKKTTLSRLRSDPIFEGDIRCDLHPRWSPDGTMISIDAVPDGDRQIYLVDVSEHVSKR